MKNNNFFKRLIKKLKYIKYIYSCGGILKAVPYAYPL